VRASRPGLRSEWLVLAAVLAASHPLVIYYGIEFRPDVWAWAAACAAIARAIRLRAGFRRALELGAAGSLCSLALPKLALLFPAYAGIDLIRRAAAREGGLVREIAGYALGIAAAVAAAAGFALAVGIDPLVAWQLSITYHQYVAAHFGMPHGLWDEFVTDRPSLLVALTGLLAWATWLRARRETPTTLELAVLVTSAFSCGSCRSRTCSTRRRCTALRDLRALLRRMGRRARHAPATRAGARPRVCLRDRGGDRVPAARRGLAQRRDRTLCRGAERGRAARAARPADPGRGAAPSDRAPRRDLRPPAHVDAVRPDDCGGHAPARAPSSRAPSAASAIRRDLEANRPAVVLFTGQREDFYSDEQTDAIAGYLADHAGEYQRAAGIAPPLWVRGDLVAAGPERAE
jgi:hypothetical protein